MACAAPTDSPEEYQYLDLIRRVIATGQPRPDRTGTGTLALFAPPSLRFSLANSALPLLTTKRVFLRGVVEELLWFISGCTDGNKLADKGVNIWEGNGSREYLDKVGLGHRRVGDLGPVYGFQWRHFGAEYGTCEDDYSGKGVDQLAEVVRKIKENPTDRRIVLSAWNPKGGLELSSHPFYLCFPAAPLASSIHGLVYITLLTSRPPANGPPPMPHVLSILRHSPRRHASQTPPLVPNVPTLMRPRPRRPIQYRVVRAPHSHDRPRHRYRATRVHPPNGRFACLCRSRRAAAGTAGEGA